MIKESKSVPYRDPSVGVTRRHNRRKYLLTAAPARLSHARRRSHPQSRPVHRRQVRLYHQPNAPSLRSNQSPKPTRPTYTIAPHRPHRIRWPSTATIRQPHSHCVSIVTRPTMTASAPPNLCWFPLPSWPSTSSHRASSQSFRSPNATGKRPCVGSNLRPMDSPTTQARHSP